MTGKGAQKSGKCRLGSGYHGVASSAFRQGGVELQEPIGVVLTRVLAHSLRAHKESAAPRVGALQDNSGVLVLHIEH